MSFVSGTRARDGASAVNVDAGFGICKNVTSITITYHLETGTDDATNVYLGDFNGLGFLKAIAYGGAATLDAGCILLDPDRGDAVPEDFPLADGVEVLLGSLHKSVKLKTVGTGVRFFLG